MLVGRSSRFLFLWIQDRWWLLGTFNKQNKSSMNLVPEQRVLLADKSRLNEFFSSLRGTWVLRSEHGRW